MIGSGPDNQDGAGHGWQPEGWDLDFDTPNLPADLYSRVDPDLMRSIDGDGEVGGLRPSEGWRILEVPSVDEAARTAAYIECMEEIRVDLYSKLELVEEPRTSSYFTETRILEDMVAEAVHDDDLVTVGECTELLLQYSALRDVTIGDVYVSPALMGDALAVAEVHRALEKERANAVHAWESGPPPDPDFRGFFPSSTPLHRSLIERCVRFGIPADHWIDTYAVNGEDRWCKMAAYLSECAAFAEDAHKQAAFQQRYDMHVVSLGGMDEALFFRAAPTALRYAADPAVRNEVAGRFVEVFRNAPLTVPNFKRVMEVGAAVLCDPDLACQYRNYFYDAYDEGPQELVKYGTPYESVVAAAYPFIKASLLEDGCSPEWIIEKIDALANGALRFLPLGSDAAQDGHVMRERNDRLASIAAALAAAGHFDKAQRVASAIPPGKERTQACVWSLYAATQHEHLDDLELDDMTLHVDPKLGVYYEVARLRVAGDFDAIIDQAARRIDAFTAGPTSVPTEWQPGYTSRPAHGEALDYGDNSLGHEYFIAAYDTLRKFASHRVADLARLVLPVYRELGAEHRHVRLAVEDLIMAGDAEEPARALEHIRQLDADSGDTSRLEALWDLAKMLRRASRAAAS